MMFKVLIYILLISMHNSLFDCIIINKKRKQIINKSRPTKQKKGKKRKITKPLMSMNDNYDSALLPLKSQDKYGRTYSRVLSRPDPVHCVITNLLETVLSVCEQNKIDVWLEYGTLLGHKRDGGIILWDYDADVGMWSHDKPRFIKAMESALMPVGFQFIVDEQFYEEDGKGCCAVYDKRWIWATQLDVIWYEKDYTTGFVYSLQSQETIAENPCAFHYRMPIEDVLPMHEVLMFGHRALIWNNYEKVLELTYGDWRKPLKDISNWIIPRYHEPSMNTVAEYFDVHSVAEMLAIRDKHVEEDTPFVLRATHILHSNEYTDLIATQTRNVAVYTSNKEDESTLELHHQPLPLVFEKFINGSLKAKVLDAPVENYDRVLPMEWIDAAQKTLGGTENVAGNALCWHIVASGSSMWHMDAINNNYALNTSAGGWVQLEHGNKNWRFLPRSTWRLLVDEGTSKLSDDIRELLVTQMDTNKKHFKTLQYYCSEILHLEPDITWGKLQAVNIKSGDLIWFPEACLHSVTTLQDSYGFGGYL